MVQLDLKGRVGGQQSPLRRLFTAGLIALAAGTIGAFLTSTHLLFERRLLLEQITERACIEGNEETCQHVYANVRAAHAAEDMVDVALWQFVAGLVGIFLVGLTLKATRDAVSEANEATEAAREAVRETSRIGEAQVRAYLSPTKALVQGPDKEMFPFAMPNEKITLYVNNSGATPANNVAYYSTYEVLPMEKARLFQLPENVQPRALFPIETVPAGETVDSEMVVFGLALGKREYERRNALVAEDTPIGLFPIIVVWGIVIYDDVFGKTFKSEFAFTYEPTASLKEKRLSMTQAPLRRFVAIERPDTP